MGFDRRTAVIVSRASGPARPRRRLGLGLSAVSLAWALVSITVAPPATADFAPVTNFGAGRSPISVAAGDVNRDGFFDDVSVLFDTIFDQGAASNLSSYGRLPDAVAGEFFDDVSVLFDTIFDQGAVGGLVSY